MEEVVQAQYTRQSNTMVQEAKPAMLPENTNTITNSSPVKRYSWWFQMIVCTIFVLCGLSVAMLLGRLYYDKGGNSKWMATLVQTVGFPVTIPFLFLASNKKQATKKSNTRKYPPIIRLSLFIFLCVFLAGDCMLYSIGLLYLPVSTYTLVCASQLGFNAFFSYFLNAQKLTPYIINSIVLLSISSALLVSSPDSSNSSTSKGKYAIGFICTLDASAESAFMLSVTQLAFRKVLKSTSFRVVIELIVYQNAIATCVILIGLFESGEWKSINKEFQEFQLGSVSSFLTLIWTRGQVNHRFWAQAALYHLSHCIPSSRIVLWISISWQVFSIGAIGLIYKISSLFSNVITTLGLPIVPVVAVFTFNDKMNGVKVISMILAIWGFVSYIYQHYIDDLKIKAITENANRRASDEKKFKRVFGERNANLVSEVPFKENCHARFSRLIMLGGELAASYLQR